MYTERNLTVQISKQTFAKQPLEIYVEWLRLERKFLAFEPHLSRQYFEPNLPFFCSCPHQFRKTRISWFFFVAFIAMKVMVSLFFFRKPPS